MLKLRVLSLIAFSTLSLLQAPVRAELTIEITGAGANRIPVAIVDFGGEPGSSRAIVSVIRGDLERSGLFKMIDAGGVAMTESSPPNYGDWRGRGADALAAGSLSAIGDNRQEARFRLYDVNKQSALTGSAFVTSTPMLRAAGHRIADVIYEQLIGEPGIFRRVLLTWSKAVQIVMSCTLPMPTGKTQKRPCAPKSRSFRRLGRPMVAV